MAPNDPRRIRALFLAGISWCYLCAFVSLYVQIPGLYGNRGLLPAHAMLTCEGFEDKNLTQVVKDCIGMAGSEANAIYIPMKLWGLTTGQSMEVLSIIGFVISVLQILFPTFRHSALYAVQLLLYYSCFKVGQTFLWFQWDTLLLEAGFLTVLFAPVRFSDSWLPHDNVTLWLIRWLLFRLMFASGIVKLTSECPTWWGLTALHWHYESQCIPTRLAWLAHAQPDFLKSLSVVATYVIEIFLPIFFLVPIRHLRVVAGYAQILLMLLIILTGNYNFFNFITIVLTLPLYISSHYSNLGTHVLQQRIGARGYQLFKALFIGVAYGTLATYTVSLFGLRFAKGELVSKIMFNKDDLYRTLAQAVPAAILLGTCLFATEVFSAFYRCFADSRSAARSIYNCIQCTVMCSAAALAFIGSTVPLSYLDNGAFQMLPPAVHRIHKVMDDYQLVHSYGLFRSMTGVGGRPEVVLVGSMELDGPWEEYEFYYKPGRLDRPPPLVAPHQPRLDWQMWFAALGTYNRNPWFLSLVYRLLHNEPDVLKLVEHNPFKDKRPPKFMKAYLYMYHYTSPFVADRHYSTTDWWYREPEKEYLPVVSLENQSLKKVVARLGVEELPAFEKTKQNTLVASVLQTIRTKVELFDDAAVFVHSVVLTVIVILVMKKFVY